MSDKPIERIVYKDQPRKGNHIVVLMTSSARGDISVSSLGSEKY